MVQHPFFKKFYLRESVRAHTSRGGGGEGRGEDSPLRVESKVGLNPKDPEIMT